MAFLVSISILLAVPVGATAAMAIRGHRSRGVNQNQIDADKAKSVTNPNLLTGGGFFTPPH